MDENEYGIILRHYSNDLVRREITRFSIGRWIAVHCQTLDKSDRPYLLRYLREAKRKIPLAINKPGDINSIIERLKSLGLELSMRQ